MEPSPEGTAQTANAAIICAKTLWFGELVQQQFGLGGQGVCAVCVSGVQCLLGLFQECSYLRGGDLFICGEGAFDPVQALLCAADQIRCFVLGSFSQRAVTC